MTYLCVLVDKDKLTLTENRIAWVALPTLPERAIALDGCTINPANGGQGHHHQVHQNLHNTFQQNTQTKPRYALAYTHYQTLNTATPQTLQPFRQFVSMLGTADIAMATKAIQLIRWQQDHGFCSRCGSTTVLHPQNDLAMVCPNCHYHQYPRLQPCVIVAITRYINQQPHILLAHHSRYNIPMYGLIAGFVEAGESLEDCIHREVMEETGLNIKNITYFASQPWPYPSNLMVGFTAEYASGELNLQLDEIDDAQFFAFDALPQIPPKGSIAHHLITHICNRNQS